MATRTVEFLKVPDSDPDKFARIEPMLMGDYHVANLNMPYQGTISERWTQAQLDQKIAGGEIKVHNTSYSPVTFA